MKSVRFPYHLANVFFSIVTMLAVGSSAVAADSGTCTPCQSGAMQDRLEKDRQAILAMAGEYRVSFRFAETVPLRDGYELHEPHVSYATEFVDVIKDDGEHIELQHVLVLDEGKRVVKHWRQTWQYEQRQFYEFKGTLTWSPRTLSEDEARGTWTQSVYEVDDSPRYAGFGRWVHHGNLSQWESNDTWRPLPRREWTKRDDYDVLVARNRHTITPTGWVHEQDNYKLVLGEDVEQPVLVREVGLNRYERVNDVDFTAGRDYWQRTEGFWREVRHAWTDLFEAGAPVQLRARVDDKPLWQHMFDYANAIDAAQVPDALEARAFVNKTLSRFIVQQ